jgi:Leucine-rich repeat (LRR) protein
MIKIGCEDFEDSLVIEDYKNLKEIDISDSEKIRKLTLKNLVNLKKCTVKGCEIEQIVIENCPNIELLNVYNNLLTSLEFVKNLSNLSSLEIGMNKKISSGFEYLPESLEVFSYKKTELFKILETYNND